MLDTQFQTLVATVLFSSVMLVAGLYVLTRYNSLFINTIRKGWLRRNIVVWMAAVCLTFSLGPLSPEFYSYFGEGKLVKYFIIQLIAVTCLVLVVFNITRYISLTAWVKGMPFTKKMITILFTIIITTIAVGIPLNYLGNNRSFKNVEIAILFNFYTGLITGLIYISMNYVELERKKKLSEKELEVTKLMALKTKAELDALHSKINPHFLYNALNSIADLAVTDGKKARKMTIALADLFRYSINYAQNNYSTINDEVAMTEVYLQIEKIRFEDQLNYSVSMDDAIGHYLVPRFLLQPMVENAVKHGLKATGKMSEIFLEIKKNEEGLIINIVDNGPLFPADLVPGYGVKSVFDKLDLLFPDQYEIHFSKEPRKQVSIHIHKLMKNEPGV